MGPGACPAVAPSEKFQIIGAYQNQLTPTYEQVLAAHGIGIAGIEVIVDGNGRTFTYDVNTNTNYNPKAEARAGVFGMRSIAQYLDGLLRQGLAVRAA